MGLCGEAIMIMKSGSSIIIQKMNVDTKLLNVQNVWKELWDFFNANDTILVLDNPILINIIRGMDIVALIIILIVAALVLIDFKIK